MSEEIKLSFRGHSTIKNIGIFVGKVKIDGDSVCLDGISNSSDHNKLILTDRNANELDLGSPTITNIKDIHHIKEGDILAIRSDTIRTLFRPYSEHNHIFATARCNSNCVMCSQPPLDIDDTEESYWIYSQMIQMLPDDVQFLGVTGGEPTILGTNLVNLINQIHNRFPKLLLDVLSNGRSFSDKYLLDVFSKIKHKNQVIWCVPLYSDVYYKHDYIVQANGAFYQTILGLHRLAALGFRTEIRVVLHNQSLERLDQLAMFIASNFPFINHVALMGIENIGYARRDFENLCPKWNFKELKKLHNAIAILEDSQIITSIYNLPLCYLPQSFWKIARQSISDWKNSFHKDCSSCQVKNKCAGFFSWNLTNETKVFPIK